MNLSYWGKAGFALRSWVCAGLVAGAMAAPLSARSQADTVRLSADRAEAIFLERNIPLLAERLNVDQADARILQAKAWPNPVLHIDDIQLYNTPDTDPSPGFFGTGFWKNRTVTAQIEQLVQLAGKRKKNIALEKSNKVLAESNFMDLLLSLKAEFRQAMAELLYLQHLSKDLAFQREVVDRLLRSETAQFKAGSISQSQLYRIKALQISLSADINEYAEQVSEQQQLLKNLMAMEPAQYLVLEEGPSTLADLERLRRYPFNELMERCLAHNTSIRNAENEKKVSEAEWVLEKAQAVPDLNLNIGYDRNGNNQLNFVGAGLAIDLPVFNRNKGNIRAARFEVEKKDLLLKNQVNSVANNLVKTWSDLQKSIQLYDLIDKDYLDKLDEMTRSVTENFQNKNIGLLEFLDFFESFKESKEKYYATIRSIALKREEVAYLTGNEL